MRSTKAMVLPAVLALWMTGLAHARVQTASSWIRSLYGQATATRGDVLLAAALISDDKTWHKDAQWAARLAVLRGYASPDEAEVLRGPARRGYAAKLFAHLIDLPGGV